MNKADRILSKLSRGDTLTDEELLYARELLHEALHLGARLGMSGDMLRHPVMPGRSETDLGDLFKGLF
jgi:hypothetical protein